MAKITTKNNLELKVQKLLDLVERQKAKIFQLSSIIKYAPGSLYWKDKNGVYLGRNDYAMQMMITANLSHDMVGKTDYELFSKEVADNFRKNDIEVMQTKKVKIEEETTITPNGGRVVQLSIKKPLVDEHGEVVGIMGNTIDITDRKKVEELSIQKEQAVKTSNMMELLAGTIAHELRTPLRSIGSGAAGIKRFLPLLLQAYQKAQVAGLEVPRISKMHYGALVSALDNIESETKSAFAVIEMLFIKSGLVNQQANMELCSITSCIDEALKRYPFRHHEKTLIHWQAKKSDIDFNFNGSQLLMIHIIFNLLKNAIYYIRAAGKGEIYIWIETGLSFNLLYFKDTGAGIPATILPKIFEQFFSNTTHGTGIGLTFAKNVMQSFGGDISCESEEGKYTEFVLKFPSLFAH